MSFRLSKKRSIYTTEHIFRVSFESIQQRHKVQKKMNSNEDREVDRFFTLPRVTYYSRSSTFFLVCRSNKQRKRACKKKHLKRAL